MNDRPPVGLFRPGQAERGRKNAAAVTRAMREKRRQFPSERRSLEEERQLRREKVHALNRNPGRQGSRNGWDLYVVETAVLARAIRDSVLYQRMNNEQKLNLGKGGQLRGVVNRLGGTTWLATEIGVDAGVVNRVLSLDGVFTGLGLADDLLLALGEQYSLHNGTVPVYANPKMRRDRWIERAEAAGVVNAEQEWETHQFAPGGPVAGSIEPRDTALPSVGGDLSMEEAA